MVSRMYERAFNFGGYDMNIVNNGVHVMDVLTTMNPSPAAIILDVVMPDKDGGEILREIRADTRYDATPVIILTNSIRDGKGETFLNAGADLFLVKMDNHAKDVVEKVTELINKGRSLTQ